MFELSVASKYLLPRRRQLSVSIISLVSILVIALVVWLIVVFFSVTEGLEKSWINKLTALTSPVRITPTEAYYRSYYYQIDGISSDSGYAHKSIGEKLASSNTDPYNPAIDEEVPSYWPKIDLQTGGSPKDLVKLAYQSVNDVKDIPGLTAHDYELTLSNIRLRLLREDSVDMQSFLSYPAYLGSFESTNSSLQQTLLPISQNDVGNLFNLTELSNANILEDTPKEDHYFDQKTFHQRLDQFNKQVKIISLKTPKEGWNLPASLIPSQASWTVYALLHGDRVGRILVPMTVNKPVAMPDHLKERGYTLVKGTLNIQDKKLTLDLPNHPLKTLTLNIPLLLQGDATLPAKLDESSIDKASRINDIRFKVNFTVQGSALEGVVPYHPLTISDSSFTSTFQESPSESPLWTYAVAEKSTPKAFYLPKDPHIGDGVLVPKSFKDVGVLIGDRGYLSYQSPTATSIQEQRIPVYVAGFYDPGIIPLGGKFILANQDITSQIRSAQQQPQSDHNITNGINIRFNDLKQAADVKTKLLAAFQKHGISPYWQVETYREYDFTKDLILQLQSERNLFTLLATVIIIVACSNIISMLIILVNDKKAEIGILRSMGATSKSIAAIFGLCGCIMGLMGSVIGIGIAVLTLNNLQALIDFISRVQGYEMFNQALYGQVMPHELSLETLTFVLIATVLISLLAGVVPAVKASLLRPSAILRSE